MDHGVEQWLATWPIPAASVLLLIWGAFAVPLIARYRRPNIQYKQFNPRGSEHGSESQTVQFLIRSFEPQNLMGKFRMQLESNTPLDSVEIVAGPWYDKATYSGDEKRIVLITLNGFPAEGVVGLRVSPSSGGCTLKALAPSKNESGDDWIVPRAWGPMETQYKWWRAYLSRMLIGAAFGAIIYLLACATLYRLLPHLFAMPPGLVDVLLLGLLLPATLAVLVLAVPRRGKDTFTGAIDWELSEHPKDNPPQAGAQAKA